MKPAPIAVTPPFFYILLIPTLLFNLLIPIYPLVIEGILIGDRGIIVSRLDLWIAIQYQGGFNRDVYVNLLLGTYSLCFLTGAIVAYLALGSIFRELLAKNEVVFGERKMAIRVIGDWFFAILFFLLLLDQILVPLTSYPGPSVFGTPSSISLYAMVGFLTGGTAIKAILPLRIQLKKQRENLVLKAEFVEASSSSAKKSRVVRWILRKKQTC